MPMSTCYRSATAAFPSFSPTALSRLAAAGCSLIDGSRAVRAGIVADLEGDDPETKLLYLTPEGLAKEEMQEVLTKLNARRLLNAIAVDEVCVAPSAVHPLPASADLVL